MERLIHTNTASTAAAITITEKATAILTETGMPTTAAPITKRRNAPAAVFSAASLQAICLLPPQFLGGVYFLSEKNPPPERGKHGTGMPQSQTIFISEQR